MGRSQRGLNCGDVVTDDATKHECVEAEMSTNPSPATESPGLASPLRLPCGVTLPNRIAKSALSEQLSDVHNRPTEELLRLYERWATGGTGLLITGNVMIDEALEEPRNVVIQDTSDLPMLTRWAEVAQAHGSHCWVQISHPGRQTIRTISGRPVAPSAVKMKFGRGLYAKPRALEDAEITALVAAFARTAQICKQAGFKGVQIHAAHGYLVSAFLSPLTNQRTDRWGGSFEGRVRFLVEILRATRLLLGPDYPIGVKLNSADFQRGGFTEEESLETLRILEREGVDLVEVSGGSYENTVMMGSDAAVRESTRAREAYFLQYTEKARAVARVPLLLTGGFRTLAGMQAALTDGAVDMIGLGRPLCVEPDLSRRLLDGTATPVPITPKRVGVRELDAVLEVFWYTQQLHRMAKGKDPDLKRGRWWPLMVAQYMIFWGSLRLKLRRKRKALRPVARQVDTVNT
jgi:2,4-dienoyl-CoA reductase-like NADH-dependent reductase (Old Yellow Enzyme family)